jgi:hypothetical protein
LRERRFGRENPLPAGDSGGIAAIRVVAPGLGQIQGTIDERVPTRRGVGQKHRDLRVLDPPFDHDRCSHALLAEAAAGGAGRDRPSEDWQPVGAGLGDVATRAVSDDPGHPLPHTAQRQQATPAADIAAALVGDHQHITAHRLRDRIAGDVRTRLTADVRFELHRPCCPREAGRAALGAQCPGTRRQPALVERIADYGRVEQRQSVKKICSGLGPSVLLVSGQLWFQPRAGGIAHGPSDSSRAVRKLAGITPGTWSELRR